MCAAWIALISSLQTARMIVHVSKSESTHCPNPRTGKACDLDISFSAVREVRCNVDANWSDQLV